MIPPATKIGIGGTGIDISDFIREVLKPEEKDVITILVDRLGIIQAHPSIAYVQRNASANNDAEKVRIYDLMPSAATRRRSSAPPSAGWRPGPARSSPCPSPPAAAATLPR